MLDDGEIQMVVTGSDAALEEEPPMSDEIADVTGGGRVWKGRSLATDTCGLQPSCGGDYTSFLQRKLLYHGIEFKGLRLLKGRVWWCAGGNVGYWDGEIPVKLPTVLALIALAYTALIALLLRQCRGYQHTHGIHNSTFKALHAPDVRACRRLYFGCAILDVTRSCTPHAACLHIAGYDADENTRYS